MRITSYCIIFHAAPPGFSVPLCLPSIPAGAALSYNQSPYQGAWNLPAGYVDVDESPKRAAERETLEEAGLQVHATRLVDVYYFDDDPRGNGLLLIYDCILTVGDLSIGDESSNACFFSLSEIPERLAGGGHDQAIRAWQQNYER